jgi:hypothetical protein
MVFLQSVVPIGEFIRGVDCDWRAHAPSLCGEKHMPSNASRADGPEDGGREEKVPGTSPPLPLTPNGKLDRAALPGARSAGDRPSSDRPAPRSPTLPSSTPLLGRSGSLSMKVTARSSPPTGKRRTGCDQFLHAPPASSIVCTPQRFAAFYVKVSPPPHPKWTNPGGILNLPHAGAATPRQLAALPQGERRI